MKNLIIFVSFLTFYLLLFELHAQIAEIDSLENLLHKHLEKDTIRVNLLNETAYKLYLINIDKTLKYAEEAEELATQIGFTKGKAESLVLIGIYCDEKSDFLEALKYYQKALKIYEKLSYKRGIAKCYNNIGIVYRYQGDYPKALEYYQKSLKIDEELGDKSGMSYRYNNIGIIYYYQGDYPKALEYYQKSLKIDEELSDKHGISSCYNNIGIIYEFQSNYSKALEYYQKSLKIGEELGDKSGISSRYNNIGTIYKYQHNYPKAYECYQKSLRINIEIGKKSTETYSYVGLASLYLEQDKTKEAYNYSKKAYTLAKEIGNVELIKESSEILAKSCNALGCYKEAYKYYVVFKTMNDSLYNEKNTKKITGLEYQYKYEKEKQATELAQQKKDAVRAEEEKQQKIVRNLFIGGFILMSMVVMLVLRIILQKLKANRILAKQKEEIEEKNTELLAMNEKIQSQSEKVKVTNEKLRVLNATKDKFFSIISHDLKSPFNSLLGISDLLLKNHKKYDEEERERYIKSISDSSKNTFNLLENLLTWSSSQSGRIEFSPQEINIKTIIHEIVLLSQPVAKNKGVGLLDLTEADISVYADKNMIDTVIRNLISNAIKFTHKKGTVIISVNATKKQGFIEISITDTGIGIPKDKIDDLFRIDKDTSTPDTENRKGTGLGLVLCKEFVEINKGEIWVESKVDKGSKFIFTLPVI